MSRRFLSVVRCVLIHLAACGSPAAPSEVPAPVVVPVAPAALASPEPSAEPEPAPEPPPPARLTVAPPANLAEAIRARRPTIEIIPQSCRGELTDGERLCIVDAETGLVRAMRRVALSDLGAAYARSYGDSVFFAVEDAEPPVTRFNFRVWQWRSSDDAYIGLAATRGENGGALVSTPFGVLYGEYDTDHAMLLADGHATRVGLGIEGLVHSATHLYEIREHVDAEAPMLELQELSWDGSRIVRGTTITVPSISNNLYFPGGAEMVVGAIDSGRTITVHITEPPAATRTVEVELGSFRSLQWIEGHLVLRTAHEDCPVDLSTGATSCEPTPSLRSEPVTNVEARNPLSFHDVFPTADGIVVVTSRRRYRLDGEGVSRAPESAHGGRSPCHCEDDTLVCREVRVEMGCTEVQELERIRVTEDASSAVSSTMYTGNGLFRTDRLEADLLRVTRFSDGARLWIRVFEGQGPFAQADDGAYAMPDELPLDAYALRWGHSLIDAPVTPLAPYQEAFLRPSLVSDFFAGRPLPAADTTLPQ